MTEAARREVITEVHIIAAEAEGVVKWECRSFVNWSSEIESLWLDRKLVKLECSSFRMRSIWEEAVRRRRGRRLGWRCHSKMRGSGVMRVLPSEEIV